MNSELLAQLDDLRRRTARLEAQEVLAKAQVLLTTGANTGATSQAQAFSYPGIAPAWDNALVNSTDGDYFNQATGASTVPTGWTAVTAASATRLNTYRGYWSLDAAGTGTGWQYRKQVSTYATSYTSYDLTDVIVREAAYTQDVTLTLSVHPDNGSGAPNTAIYTSLEMMYNSTLAVWMARGVHATATQSATGAWYALPSPLPSPLQLRVTINASLSTRRTYISTVNKRGMFLLLNSGISSTTAYGTNPWLQIKLAGGDTFDRYVDIGGMDRNTLP